MSNSWWGPLCGRKRIRRGLQGVVLSALLIGGAPAGGAEEFVYKGKDRDPFWPLVTEDGKLVEGFDVMTLENVYLEGIVVDPHGDSVVMINGMVLRKGDRIGGFEILKIENGRVTLRSGNERRYLNLEKTR